MAILIASRPATVPGGQPAVSAAASVPAGNRPWYRNPELVAPLIATAVVVVG
ncbi:MAG: hypothetical protein O3B31_02620 [Chloroflexi bacterium]|nr:hypothetical protein [Chloroflexota bacterium]MDA1002234.1 hypothetical protein [Chloroflexota bacterium]